LAPETWRLVDLVAAGWTQADLAWERSAEAAMERLADGDMAGAGGEIARSVRIARNAFAGNDPRLGTSLANHGAAMTAGGESEPGGRTVRDGIAVWRACDGWVAEMRAPRMARSSLFHLRMEQRHRQTYEDRWRAKWAELVAEARSLLDAPGAITPVSAAEAGERLARWQRERPPFLNDTRMLLAAVLLLACRAA
jgi:hypothetical protein